MQLPPVSQQGRGVHWRVHHPQSGGRAAEAILCSGSFMEASSMTIYQPHTWKFWLAFAEYSLIAALS